MQPSFMCRYEWRRNINAYACLFLNYTSELSYTFNNTKFVHLTIWPLSELCRLSEMTILKPSILTHSWLT